METPVVSTFQATSFWRSWYVLILPFTSFIAKYPLTVRNLPSAYSSLAPIHLYAVFFPFKFLRLLFPWLELENMDSIWLIVCTVFLNRGGTSNQWTIKSSSWPSLSDSASDGLIFSSHASIFVSSSFAAWYWWQSISLGLIPRSLLSKSWTSIVFGMSEYIHKSHNVSVSMKKLRSYVFIFQRDMR